MSYTYTGLLYKTNTHPYRGLASYINSFMWISISSVAYNYAFEGASNFVRIRDLKIYRCNKYIYTHITDVHILPHQLLHDEADKSISCWLVVHNLVVVRETAWIVAFTFAATSRNIIYKYKCFYMCVCINTHTQCTHPQQSLSAFSQWISSSALLINPTFMTPKIVLLIKTFLYAYIFGGDPVFLITPA